MRQQKKGKGRRNKKGERSKEIQIEKQKRRDLLKRMNNRWGNYGTPRETYIARM